MGGVTLLMAVLSFFEERLVGSVDFQLFFWRNAFEVVLYTRAMKIVAGGTRVDSVRPLRASTSHGGIFTLQGRIIPTKPSTRKY